MSAATACGFHEVKMPQASHLSLVESKLSLQISTIWVDLVLKPCDKSGTGSANR